MVKVHIRTYPNLVFTGEAQEGLSSKDISDTVKTKMAKSMHQLNSHGNNKNFITVPVEKTHRYGIWEMKFKDKSKTEWRIFFKKISKKVNPAEYAVINVIRKTTPKLTKQDLDTAERIAKREGW